YIGKEDGIFLAEVRPADTGPDENQLRDALAVLQRKVDRRARADGTAHQVNGLQLELVDQREQVSHRRPTYRRQLRLAEAPRFRADHVEVLGEGCDLRPPHA